MGPSDSVNGLQIGIHGSTSFGGSLQDYTSSKRPISKSSTGKGVKRPFTQAGHSSSHSSRVSLPLPVFILPDTKKTRHMETHPKFKAVEQAVYTPSSLQDGNPCCHHSVPQEGSLGHHLGFKGCIPACTHSSSSSAVSLLQLQRGRLCFQGDAVRPLDSTPSIYQDHQDGYRLPQTSGYHSICLSRRLANSIQVPSRSPEGYQLHDSSPTVPGLDHQRGEVFSHPITAPHVLGSSSRPFPGHSVPVGGQTSCHLGPSCCHPIGGSVPSPRLVTSLGTDGEPRRCRSFLPPQNEALTIAHASAVPPVHGCTVQSDRHDIGCQASCRMVDVTTQFNEGQAFPRPQGESSNNDGCVTLGLGRNLGVRDSLRPVVYTGEVSAHKLVGDGSSKESHSPLEVTSSQQVPDNSDGQLNGSLLPQSSRRDKVNNPVHAHTQPAFRGRRHKSPDQGLPSSRERKCGRRRPVKGLDNGPKGVDSQVWAEHMFELYGRPLVDLFATAGNARLPTFCSRYFHPQAWAVDALSIDWNGILGYAFPPWNLIHHVLTKLRDSRASLILIAPFWPRQPWFPLLTQLLVDSPFKFPPRGNLLTQLRGRILHPDVKSLQLSAWPLSGETWKQKAFRKKLSTLPPVQGEIPLYTFTTRECADSETGQWSVVSIPWKHH